MNYQRLLGRWEAAYEAGLMGFTIEQRSERNDTQWASLEDDDHVARAIAWVAHGWALGQQRYPEPSVSYHHFKQLAEALELAEKETPMGAKIQIRFSSDSQPILVPLPEVSRPRARMRAS